MSVMGGETADKQIKMKNENRVIQLHKTSRGPSQRSIRYRQGKARHKQSSIPVATWIHSKQRKDNVVCLCTITECQAHAKESRSAPATQTHFEPGKVWLTFFRTTTHASVDPSPQLLVPQRDIRQTTDYQN